MCQNEHTEKFGNILWSAILFYFYLGSVWLLMGFCYLFLWFHLPLGLAGTNDINWFSVLCLPDQGDLSYVLGEGRYVLAIHQLVVSCSNCLVLFNFLVSVSPFHMPGNFSSFLLSCLGFSTAWPKPVDPTLLDYKNPTRCRNWHSLALLNKCFRSLM